MDMSRSVRQLVAEASACRRQAKLSKRAEQQEAWLMLAKAYRRVAEKTVAERRGRERTDEQHALAKSASQAGLPGSGSLVEYAEQRR
jgi:hypothetical protein